MLKPEVLVDFLKDNNVTFYSGVPDSLLKDFCAYIDDEFPASNHISLHASLILEEYFAARTIFSTSIDLIAFKLFVVFAMDIIVKRISNFIGSVGFRQL